MDGGDSERIVRRLRNLQSLGRLVGDSCAFRDSVAVLPAAAESEAAVLIAGETGTGKELVARAIHYLSNRAGRPFVAVNCGALTDGLLEDELFGHERGAFTDARDRRTGLLEHAQGGTVLLDEVDSLTARGQVALLRVLQDRRVRRLGSSEEREVDVRFLAATNVPLLELVERGRFRGDLYYRLCVFSVSLPPLRERLDDISALATHFVTLHAPKGKARVALSPEAVEALLAFRWPGNVRELENVMVRATRLCEGDAIRVAHLGLPGVGATPSQSVGPGGEPGRYQPLKRLAIQSFERDYLVRLLRASEGNVTRAARIAGKERRDLGRLLKKHHLDPKGFAPTRV